VTPALLADSIEVLLVEDNPGDVRLTREALRESRVRNRISVARDGIEALEMLRAEGPHEDTRRPDLILLDLNLPRMNGRELLAEIKKDPRLRRIPVVILTSSREEEDIARTYDLHANAFVTKPVDFEQFVRAVRSIEDFWLTVVKLPPK
jgi:two-component system, chemotaxis family, response regulator Rcp1